MADKESQVTIKTPTANNNSRGVQEGSKRGNYSSRMLDNKSSTIEKITPELLEEETSHLEDLDDESISNSYTMLAIPTMERGISTEVQLRRLQVHRLILRGVPRTELAKHFGVSIHTIYRDCSLIYKAIKQELKDVDLPAFVGLTVAFYDDVRNAAMKIATNDRAVVTVDKNGKTLSKGKIQVSNKDKVLALNTALKAESDKQNYLKGLGLYGDDTNPFGVADDETDDVAAELLDTLEFLISDDSPLIEDATLAE